MGDADYEILLKQCREFAATRFSMDESIRWLHSRSANIIDAIKIVRNVHGIGLSEAKRRVTEHPAYAAVALAAIPLHKELDELFVNHANSVQLFIYGTLKRGHSRNKYLNGQRFLGESRTAARYLLFDCGSYPGLVLAPSGTEGRAIEGEVWDVDGACLAILDKVEAVDEGLYRRERVELEAPFDATTVETYYFNQSTCGLRDCGSCWQ